MPPDALRGMAGLMDRQSGQLGKLASFCTTHCGNVTGLDNALEVVKPVLTKVSDVHSQVLGNLKDGASYTRNILQLATTVYERQDQAAAESLKTAFPSAPSVFPDLSKGGSPHHWNDAANPAFTAPTDSTDEGAETGDLQAQIDGLRNAVATAGSVSQQVLDDPSIARRMRPDVLENMPPQDFDRITQIENGRHHKAGVGAVRTVLLPMVTPSYIDRNTPE